MHGEVVRSWAAWDSEHKYIWTHYEVSVAEALRGPYTAAITVSEPGGSLDGVNMQTSGTLPFAVGEDTVLFLYKTPIGYWRAVGGPQNRIHLEQALPSQPKQNPRAAPLEGISAGDFLARVRRLAAAHPYRGGR